MKDPAFLFYSKDFYEGTRMMLPEERACYIDLMIYQHQNGYIPDDPQRLLLYCSGIAEATLKAVLQAKFKLCSKGWYNEKLQGVTDERDNFSKRQSVNGTVGQFWKKAKATLKNKKEFENLRKKLSGKSNHEIYELLQANKINDSAPFEAMLIALLKHLAIADAIVNENINIEDTEKKEEVQEEKTWRNDFETYKTSLRAAYNSLICDSEFLSCQQRYHPGVNIPLSLEKSCVNYWATEAGWKHKRRSKADDLDWKRTLTNALSQPQNKVYERSNANTDREAAKRAGRQNLEVEALRFLTGASGEAGDGHR